MPRHATLPLSLLFVLGLVACDKGKDADKAAKAEPAEKEVQEKPSEPPPAEAADAGAEQPPPAPEVKDDTVGLAAIVRTTAKDDEPAGAPADVPTYDTSKDAGGLIGHLSSGLSHDDELADSPTAKELATLAHESDETPSDAALCTHVFEAIFTTAYADAAEAGKDAFQESCKHEVEKQRVKLGIEIFAQHAACMMAASDLAALDRCDAAEQAAEDFLHANPHGDGVDESNCTAAVEHFFILVTRELTSDPDLLEILEEDIYSIKEDAVLACRDEATKAEITCVMKAAALKDLEGCTGGDE